jgi:peptidoglycan/LPS O-acetylase OafA/YrhL
MSGTQKFDFIDALRGWAILLVIICHAGLRYSDLPWPLKRETNLGWHGVQLFFVVSALTLVLSWHARVGKEVLPVTNFFIRRIFRILPMFALAAALYIVLRPPGANFSIAHLAFAMTFVNGWNPGTLPTAAGSWEVVPGGWSIAAEFGFYAIFPGLALTITTLRRALLASAAALAFAAVVDPLAVAFYEPEFGRRAAEQFVYYWLPNQLPVFLSGFVVYYVLQDLRMGGPAWRRARMVIGECGGPLVALAGVIFLALGYRANIQVPSIAPPAVPTHIIAAILFAAVTIALALVPRTIWTNRLIVQLGRVSFSAYLLHFAVLDGLRDHLAIVTRTDAGGLEAVLHFPVFLALATVITFSVSSLTYVAVEKPMIRVGQWLCGQLALRRRRLAPA